MPLILSYASHVSYNDLKANSITLFLQNCNIFFSNIAKLMLFTICSDRFIFKKNCNL